MRTGGIAPGDSIAFDDERYLVEGLLVPSGNGSLDEAPRGPMFRLRGAEGVLIVAVAHVYAHGFRKLRRPSTATEIELPSAETMTSRSRLTAGIPRDAVEADRGALWEDLPQTDRTRVLKVEETIWRFRGAAEEGNFKGTSEQRAAQAAAELGLRSARQFYRHLNAYGVHNDWWALVPGPRRKTHNPYAGLDIRLAQAMADQHAVELEESGASVNRFKRRLKERLKVTYGDGEDRVVLPSDRTLERKIKLLLKDGNKGTFLPTKARRELAGQPAHMFVGATLASRPGQVVMLDTHDLNINAYDPVVDAVVPLQVTVALDLCTRSILAWRITAESTKAVDATMMVADTLVPLPTRPEWQEKLRFEHMSVQAARVATLDERLADAAALPLIYPELFLIDNGKVFVSDAMKSACRRLGISIPRARPYQATDKAHVERLFGTVQTMFAEHVAGYRGRDVSRRGPAVAETARWSIEEIEEFFAEWVVTVYQRRAHAGLQNPWAPKTALSPNDAYAAALEVAGFVPAPQDPDLFYELLPLRWRMIRAAGVVIDKRWYNGEVLADLRHMSSHYPGRNKQWPIRIDPRNLMFAYVKDPAGTWHTLSWTRAQGMLLCFSDRMASYARQELRGRGIHHPDEEDVFEMAYAQQNRMDAPETWQRKDRKGLSKDRAAAKAEARDRARAHIGTEADIAAPADPALADVPVPAVGADTGEDLVLDLANVVALGVFGGPSTEESDDAQTT